MPWDADFIRYDIHSDEYYNVQYSLPGAGVFRKQELRNLESTDIGIRAYQAEAQFPLGKNGGRGGGEKKGGGGGRNRTVDTCGQEWFPDLEKTNAFDYDEDVYAAFASFHTQWKKADIQAGLRLERTTSEGDVASAHAALKRRYTDFFPSFSINIPLRNQRQIGISYSRRIDRPGYQRLNPFLFFIDPLPMPRVIRFCALNTLTIWRSAGSADPWSVSHTRDVNTFVSSQNDSLLVGIAGTRNLDHLYNINLTVTGQQQITAWWSAFNFLACITGTGLHYLAAWLISALLPPQDHQSSLPNSRDQAGFRLPVARSSRDQPHRRHLAG
ncbi:MAG: TonB-dependent receptor family protein [Lewinellaceae bacterium]|nr:TonB-dependent receptor family protein [Lewinellaceae bacterium]